MNHMERFYASIERKPADRQASWLGLPTPGAEKRLMEYLHVNRIDEVKKIIDDDLYTVEMPYHSPTSNAIYSALNFSKKDASGNIDERTLTAPGFFEDYSDPEAINDFNWPDPSKYIDACKCRETVEVETGGRPIMGAVWSAHFQDACSAFGMETALVKMLTEPDMFRAVINRITEFYLNANEIFYSAAKGKLDAVLIGNDLGSQTGLILSPDAVREFVMPGTKKLIQQAKSYGLKVFFHSCGSIFDIIPDLIDAGVDVIHPIQALAKGMEAYRLQKHFGDRVSFCGGIDTQELLVYGRPEQIKNKVRELKDIFPTGIIISPSHEAILPDVAPENILALFEAVNGVY